MADEDPRSDSEIPVGVEHVAGIDFRPEAYDALLATKVRGRMNNELNFPPNFERLVLGCIDASKQASKQGRAVPLEEKEKRRDPGIRAQLKYT